MGKQSLYDHSVRVPLIIAGPGIRGGQEATTLCYLYDIFPTIFELTDRKIPESVEGQSLVPALRNPASNIREELLLSYTQTQRALRTAGDWKLIRTRFGGEAHTQLFNLKSDPWEMRNLAGDKAYSTKLAELTNRLNASIFDMKDDYFQPVFEVKHTAFGAPPEVSFMIAGDGLDIRYTTDGSEPDARSTLYLAPFLLYEAATVKAGTFDKDKCISPVATEQVTLVDKFTGLTLDKVPHKNYTGRGVFTLADGQRGGVSHHDGKWLGFNGDDLAAAIDLGEMREVREVRIGYLSTPGAWIFPPKRVQVFATRNREQWVSLGTWEGTELQAGSLSSGSFEVTVACKPIKTRLLKIVVENQGLCPEWHDGKGQKAWLFVDEVWVE